MTYKNENTLHRLESQGNGEGFHTSYEREVERLLDEVRGPPINYPDHIDGKERLSAHRFRDVSPGDERLLVGVFQRGHSGDVNDAVRASRNAFPMWSKMDWTDRMRFFTEASDIMRRRKYELAAAISLDNGKNRYEAVADVDEAIDFINYYCSEMRRNQGFERVGDPPYPEEEVRVLLRPYGVWAVICPFNFPLAITTGMTVAALLTGNTAVLKPSSSAPLPVHLLYDVLDQAGLPDGVLNLVSGYGTEVGDPLANHPTIDGVAFTGSLQVGQEIMRSAPLGRPRPVIAELGSKNPVIVSLSADLEKAAQGVTSSAFGFSGQKCSACSRLYVHEAIFDEFMEMMVDMAESLTIGSPFERETEVGPLITKTSMDNYIRWTKKAARDGKVLTGGGRDRTRELAHGYYARPTIVTGLPDAHELMQRELFAPLLCAQPYSSMPEALSKANSTEFGLTAGLFSRDQSEISEFLEEIQFGVVYVNRERGGSTGAMVGGQAFTGWKISGSTGKGTGSVHYLPQFMREQSRTVCR